MNTCFGTSLMTKTTVEKEAKGSNQGGVEEGVTSHRRIPTKLRTPAVHVCVFLTRKEGRDVIAHNSDAIYSYEARCIALSS